MSKRKHSFIQFYMDDWAAGTMRMPRPTRSLYFDVCFYNWDKAAPMPVGEQRIAFADLGGSAGDMIDALVEAGSLCRDDNGGLYSERAMIEAERAYGAWEAKSRGGKGARGQMKDRSKRLPAKMQHSSTEPEPEPEPEEERGADAPPKKVRPPKPKPAKGNGAKPPAIPAEAKKMIPELWNEIARASGLSPILKMNKARQEQLNARLKEHDLNVILEAIRTIPKSRFLMGRGPSGWKANFDWLLQPSSMQKLIEGYYHNEGRGKGSAWLN